MTPEDARREIADMAVQAAIYAVKSRPKPDWAQTLKIVMEVRAEIAEAAAGQTTAEAN